MSLLTSSSLAFNSASMTCWTWLSCDVTLSNCQQVIRYDNSQQLSALRATKTEWLQCRPPPSTNMTCTGSPFIPRYLFRFMSFRWHVIFVLLASIFLIIHMYVCYIWINESVSPVIQSVGQSVSQSVSLQSSVVWEQRTTQTRCRPCRHQCLAWVPVVHHGTAGAVYSGNAGQMCWV